MTRAMTPSPQGMESPAIPGRFTRGGTEFRGGNSKIAVPSPLSRQHNGIFGEIISKDVDSLDDFSYDLQ